MIAHKKFHVFIFGVIILLCMVIPVSAISPAPKEVYTSLRLTYSKFALSKAGSYNTTKIYDSTGAYVNKPNSTFGFLTSTSLVDVTSLGYSPSSLLFFYINTSGSYVQACWYSCFFYDSNRDLISFEYYGTSVNNFSIVPPSGTVYIKYTVCKSYALNTISGTNAHAVAVPYVIDDSNATSDTTYKFLFENYNPASVNGDYVIFPVTTYEFDAFRLDVQMFDEAVDTTDISFTMSLEAAPIGNPSSFESLALSSSSNLPVFRAYHFENGEKVFSSKLFVYELSQDGLSFTLEADLNEPFSGFEVQYVFADTSYYLSGGYLRAKFDDFTLNYDEEYELKYILQEMDDLTDEKQEQVSAVISDLTLPTPNMDDAFSGLDDLSTAYHNSEIELVATFHILYDSFPIIVLFMTLSISMTVLGYILFGKSG